MSALASIVTQDITTDDVIDILRNASIRSLGEAIERLDPIMRAYVERQCHRWHTHPVECSL